MPKAFYSCGKCCNKNEPCEECIKTTLKSNGLSLDLLPQLKGLSHIDNSHCPPTYSPFHEKIKELIKLTHPSDLRKGE